MVELARSFSTQGVVPQVFVFEIHIKDIHAESIHPPVQPEAIDIQHGLADLRVTPVQVRLFLVEHVEIILVEVLVVFPAPTPKPGQPIVGRTAFGRWIMPHVPVVVRVIF